ncbi:MAG: hypothetical protein HWQ23_05525 [Nostoc sp. JL33]|nr:hypothetical protein [Nostoc sp. JL33]
MQADALTMQADALRLQDIAKFNLLRINGMLYLDHLVSGNSACETL